MIFVTVGTHEQPFNRLVEYIDKLKENHVIDEEVIIQTGFSTYEPKYCEWSKLYTYKDMIRFVNEARIVITHGGPSSFTMPLQVGKIPVVVPRKKKYDEHVNNHQVEFSKAVAERQGNILVVEEIDDLKDIILNYDSIVSNMPNKMKSNNLKFNDRIERIVEEMFKGEN
jgi:UDP-N-acetylglucosamine transferase subunit ALG13